MPNTLSAQDSALAGQFMTELLERTVDAPTETACREVLQTFINTLVPWMRPSDFPAPPRPLFTLFEDFYIDEEDGDTVWGAFTPEGSALFRAWLRRRGVAL